MPVVDVRVVRVLVRQNLVSMPVRMRPISAPGEGMLMLVMLIVPVLMRVLEWLVGMQVQVPLSRMQPDPKNHQRRSHPEQ